MPDSNERIRAKQRDHLLAERHVEAWIPEHRRHVDGEIEQQLLHHFRLVEHSFLQRAYVAESLFLNALPEPASNRRIGVGPEVEPVVTEDSLQ